MTLNSVSFDNEQLLTFIIFLLYRIKRERDYVPTNMFLYSLAYQTHMYPYSLANVKFRLQNVGT